MNWHFEANQSWNRLVDNELAPSLLYHYTDFAGLKGILASGQLWATDASTLNDGSEIHFGRSTVVNAFESALEYVGVSVGDVMQDVKNIAPERVFVTCFCQRHDLLSMWRAYAGEGGGYCLAFGSSELSKLQVPHLEPGMRAARLVKIHYGSELPQDMIDMFRAECYLIRDTDYEPDKIHYLWVLANAVKHKSFEEEQEWRIFAPDPHLKDLEFRSGHANIKPYVKLTPLNNARLPLKKVFYGPTLRSEDNPSAILKLMLEKYGYPDVEVRGTEIPYRL